MRLFNVITKWYRLTWADRFLYLKILYWTAIVRSGLLILPFRCIAGYLGDQGIESPLEEELARLNMAQHLGRSIEITSRHTPWKSKCLVQAITGKILLRKLGISSTLYLGVKKHNNHQLLAHAWLRVGTTIITGKVGMDEFTVVSCFGTRI